MFKPRIRMDEKANYLAFFNAKGQTIRFMLDGNKPMLSPKYPDLEDVAINNKCYAQCPYCYISAENTGSNFEDICEKALDYYGKLEEKERPFQIAIGGAGEPTLHPDFPEFVKVIRLLNIVPNYTTNGMHLSKEVLEATKEYCGGVAISWHPHLGYNFFKEKALILRDYTDQLNTHIIVGQKGSYEQVVQLYNNLKDVFSHFVLLPYQSVGRATEDVSTEEFKKIFDFISTVDSTKFAFGALFYEYLTNNEISININIYEPELCSGYRVMDDTYKRLRYSSYNREFKS